MDEDDDSKTLQPQIKATIVQITKSIINNNDAVPEKSLGLRAKSILTQVSLFKIFIENKLRKQTFF